MGRRLPPYPGGITNSRWENMYGGDGFWMFADPSDPNYVYAEAQGGEIGRVNRITHEMRGIKPQPNYGEEKLRFNWNTPIAPEPDRAGNDLHRRAVPLPLARSRADLGSHLPRPHHQRSRKAEAGGIGRRHGGQLVRRECTPPSSRSASRRATGRSSGRARTTATCSSRATAGRLGRTSWAMCPASRRSSWVTWVEASRFDAGTAYATFDRHTFGDMEPYAYRSTDYGRTCGPKRNWE